MKILTVQLPLRLRARLVGKLKESTVVPAASIEEALEHLRNESFELLIFQESEHSDSLVALASFLPHHKGRVLFCARQGHASDFQNQLVKRLRVTAILQHPVDPDELVRRASVELDTRVPVLEARVASNQTIPKALLPVWQRHQETNRERVDILVGFLEQESPDETWLEGARRAAHQLAGSLGTFGLASASLLAREAESLVTAYPQVSAEQSQRLFRVIHALQLQVEDPQLKLPDLDREAPLGSLLIFSIDSEWSQRFSEAASEAGYHPLLTDDPAGARRLLAMEQPRRLVVDLGDLGLDGLTLIHDLSGQGRQLVALYESGAAPRVQACTTLRKPVADSDILAELEQAETPQEEEKRKVLAVDDDPIVLETLQALLQSMHIEVYPLQDPLRFWEMLNEVQPDLVMLDVDLPYVGGVELCRALRAEPTYFDLPVIFLSAYNDAETVHRVFVAGGDDYVFKPIIGPELLTRTRNRLARLTRQSVPTAQVRSEGGVAVDLAYLIQPEELSRELFSRLSLAGFSLERLPESGPELVERLTCNVSQRPRLVLLDALLCNDVVQGFDGLGINNYSQVWLRGDLTEEEIQWVYEWGLAGYLPDGLDINVLVRKLERALRAP